MVSVYVSYAWKEEAQKPLVEKLDQACMARGIELCYDKKKLGYGDSIRQFMNQIGAAGHIVLVLSEAYFKSDYCMYELCRIHENGGFHKRVSPIVLARTPLYKPVERVRYLKHWEKEIAALEAELADLDDPKHTQHTRAELDDYAKFRRLIDQLQHTLADMNTLTEDVHRDTDFAALLARIAPEKYESDGGERAERDTRVADAIFLATVEDEVSQALAEVPALTQMIRDHALQKGLTGSADRAALARWLCTSPLDTVLDDVLRPATRAALPRKSPHAIRESDVWEAAKSLLFWLSVLAVRPDWVQAQEENDRHDAGGGARFSLFVRTGGGAEIVSSRYRQVRPDFRPSGGLHVVGRGRIELSDLESGFNDAQAIDGLLIDVARHFGEQRGDRLLDPEQRELLAEFIRDALEYDEKHKTGHHYILVDADENSPLQRPAVYDALHQLLPRLRIIYLQKMPPSGDQNPLLLRETRLITIIRGFLNLPDTLR